MNTIGADKCQNADAACRSLPDRKLHGDCLADVEILRNNNEVVDRGARILLELDLHDVFGDDVTLKAYLDRGKMSGSISKSSDRAREEADWSHYHVVRGMNPEFFRN